LSILTRCGLSATPKRYDGNGDIIELHLGPIFADSDLEGTMEAKITVLLLDYEIDTPRRYQYVHWGGSFQRARYLNMMRKSKPFIRAIRGLLSRLKDDRNLLCMVERIKLIDDLYNWAPSNSKGKFCGVGTKMEELDKQITFSTPGKGRDGIDAPWKDCVIMTSPISNIEQLIGRVLRTKAGKKTPIVIDMVDYGSRDIKRTFYTRQKFYEKKRWPVQYLFLKDGKLRKVDQSTALNILEGR
jgi:superfamily II DNA or RNA helicase